MDKRAFLVLGAESTGTRLVTEILCRNGCTGDWTHYQKWDNHSIHGDLVVWRRSVPHLGNWLWPYVPEKDPLKKLRSHGYKVTVVITTRDWNVTAMSQLQNGHVKGTMIDAEARIRRAYSEIFSFVDTGGCSKHYRMVSYDSICLYPTYAQMHLLLSLGFDMPLNLVDIKEGNGRRWDEINDAMVRHAG